jgi:putative membrane protein
MYILLHIVALAAAVLGVARLLPGVEVKGWRTAIIVAVVFSLLNFFLGWLVQALLVLPVILSLGLLYFFVPFIVNTVLLWLTDKLIGDFEIKTWRALLGSALVITVVNWLCHAVEHHQRLPRSLW